MRTDRNTEFFTDLEGPQLRQLNDILVTYTFFNFDLGTSCSFPLRERRSVTIPLGYVQGMNDLLSPIMMVMEDEVDSFWCFKGIMDMMVVPSPNNAK